LAELDILHHQLDLVDLQLMKESAGLIVRTRIVRFRPCRFQMDFRATTQLSGIKRLALICGHVMTLAGAGVGNGLSRSIPQPL
jgi:hypothetical protein